MGMGTNAVVLPRSNATPTSTITIPRYIGLRLNRNNPFVTTTVDFSKGTTGVPTLENALAATATIQIPVTTSGPPAYLKGVESS